MSHEQHLTPFDAADDIDWHGNEGARWPIGLTLTYALICSAMLWVTIVMLSCGDWWGAGVYGAGALFVVASPWLFGERGSGGIEMSKF